MQIEEAERGSQSLEDTGDFASRLAAISNKSRGAASAMSCKTSDSDETISPIGQESLNRNAEDVSLYAGTSIISAKQSETGEGSKQEDVSRTVEGINQIKTANGNCIRVTFFAKINNAICYVIQFKFV